MALRTLPGLGIKGGWANGADGWGADANDNWLKLSVASQLVVDGIVAALPTGGLANGQMYVLTATANKDKVAVRDEGVWVYITPTVGWRLYNKADGEVYTFTGTAWEAPAPVVGGGGIADAPNDGKEYNRKNGGWVEDLEPEVGIEDVPASGKTYNRKRGEWVEYVPPVGGGGGIPEAPTDGKLYARKDAAWAEIILDEEPETPIGYGAHAYWRMRRTASSDDTWVSLAELKLGSNATVGGETIFSGQHDDGTYAARVVFDGDTGTIWSTGNPAAAYVGYHFPTPVSVNEVKLSAGGAPWLGHIPTGFNVEYSDDGTTWTVAWSATTPAWTTPNETRTFASPDPTPEAPESIHQLAVATRDANFTFDIPDAYAYLRVKSATAITATVPASATKAFRIGTQIHLRRAGNGSVTIAAAAGVVINTPETLKLRKVGSSATLVKVAADEWDLMGDLEAV